MTVIHAETRGNKALIPRAELERLVELACRAEPVELELQSETATDSLMRMADEGRSFDFWRQPAEDIYSEEDGEPV